MLVAEPVRGIGLADLLRDTRHLAARAAPDLADWLAYLSVEGKADRSLYTYMRTGAGLLNMYPDKTQAEFTAADITTYLATIKYYGRVTIEDVAAKVRELGI